VGERRRNGEDMQNIEHMRTGKIWKMEAKMKGEKEEDNLMFKMDEKMGEKMKYMLEELMLKMEKKR
jgi:hypothetical protein